MIDIETLRAVVTDAGSSWITTILVRSSTESTPTTNSRCRR